MYKTDVSKCPSCGAPFARKSAESTCSYCGAELLVYEKDEQREEMDGDAYVRQGVDAYVAEEYRSAVKALERAIDLGVVEHDLAEAYTILGNSYDRLENLTRAVWAHKQALAINPDYHKAWVNLGIVYRRAGDLKEAKKCYEKALDIAPAYPELYASLGALHIYLDEPQKAIEILEKAIALNPALGAAHGNIALAYAMVGLFDEAEAALKRAVTRGSKNYRAIMTKIKGLKMLQEQL